MNIKEVFSKAETDSLTYEQFCELAKEAGCKFTDLSEGGYVSKKKYEDDLLSKDTEITGLNETITGRDKDLKELNEKLANAGNDTVKLNQLSSDLATLQGKYDADTKELQSRLTKQQYEFAVKDYANGKNFTSKAAKRDFIRSMIDKELKYENGKILGAEEFVQEYTNDYGDSFVVETPPEEAKPKLPEFVQPTPGATGEPDTGGFKFNFTGVRTHDDK